MPSKWPRINWNKANAKLANRPFADIFKEKIMKPCPFCGHDIIKLDSWPVNDHREYAGVCQNCGAQGPNDLGITGAMEMWEMRRSEDTLQAEATALRQRLQAVEGQRGALEAEVAALRAQRSELAVAGEAALHAWDYADTSDELWAAMANWYDKYAEIIWGVLEAHAALARLPSPSGEDRGEVGE